MKKKIVLNTSNTEWELQLHDCFPCAYLKKRKLEGVNLRTPHCISPDRRPKDNTDRWIPTNNLGEKCPYFTEGNQLLFDEYKRSAVFAKDRK